MNSFFFNPLKEIETVKLIGNYNSNKRLGRYSIAVKVLKNHVDSFKQTLTFLIFLFKKVFSLTLWKLFE